MATNEVEKALTVLQGIGGRDADVATQYMHPTKYTSHHPEVSEGVAGFRQWMGQLPQEKSPLKTVRAFQDGAYVFTNSEGNLHGSKVFFDIFQFADGQIVEQWAFEEPMGLPNQSGHTQLDGPTRATSLQDTEKNKAFVRGYYETVHLAGDHSKIPQYISVDHVRHEPGVRDGVAAFLQDLASFNQPGKPSRTIDEIKLLFGHGDLVFVGATGTLEGDPCIYVDLYRVDGKQLVEHWGFMDKVPPLEKSKTTAACFRLAPDIGSQVPAWSMQK